MCSCGAHDASLHGAHGKISVRKIYLQDSRSFVKSLSYRRLRNYQRLIASYKQSRKSGQARHRGFPMALSIEPTTSCNLRCPECPSGLRSFLRPTGMADFSLFAETMDELGDELIYLTLYFQGEPFLHPEWSYFIHKASAKKIYTITSTNGHFLSESICNDIIDSGLSRLIVSIDGAKQDSYSEYRVGGKLSRVIDGVKRLMSIKKARKSSTPHVVMQSIVFRSNEHELEDLKKNVN